MKKIAIIVEKRWNIETEGNYTYGGLTPRKMKIDKYKGWYLFGFIPLYIKHIETEYHGKI